VQAAEDKGFKTNREKNKYVVTGKCTASSPTISIVCYNFQKVESFVCLGTVEHSDGGVTMEIKTKLGAANKCYFGFMNHLSSKLCHVTLTASFIKH
jgi:hypothetical protein